MRFNKLDLNLLVALDALLTECNITRAAQRIHLSQSAMSNALGRLREYLDDELLVQVGRKMEPTPRAIVLREAVRDLLLRINTTFAAQPEFDPSRSDREFTLFVSDYSMEIFIPQVLAQASRQRSTVRFRLLPQVAHPHRALERGEADLLLIPRAYVSPDQPSEVLFSEKFVCAMWDRSHLARSELTIERYVNAGHVVMHPAESQQPAFEEWFVKQHGISRRIEVSTYSFGAMPHLVVGTELIATVHTRLAERLQKSLPIKLAPVPLPIPPIEQMMQWHKYRTQDPGLIWLRNAMVQAAVAMDAQTDSGHP